MSQLCFQLVPGERSNFSLRAEMMVMVVEQEVSPSWSMLGAERQ